MHGGGLRRDPPATGLDPFQFQPALESNESGAADRANSSVWPAEQRPRIYILVLSETIDGAIHFMRQLKEFYIVNSNIWLSRMPAKVLKPN